MGGRTCKLLLALWWLAWTCVIVPAHTRGAVGVDGALARDGRGRAVSFLFSSLPNCCQTKQVPGQKPAKANPGNCAICLLVANTGLTADLPPIVQAPQQTRHLFVPRTGQVAGGKFVPAYQGRAPPAAA